MSYTPLKQTDKIPINLNDLFTPFRAPYSNQKSLEKDTEFQGLNFNNQFHDIIIEALIFIV